MQFCLTPGLVSARSKGIKYKYVKNIKQNHRDYDKRSDTNQLEPGKGVGLSPKYISWIFISSFGPIYENYLISIFMNINENLKNEDKTIGFTSTQKGDQTYIEPLGAFLIDVKWLNEAT